MITLRVCALTLCIPTVVLCQIREPNPLYTLEIRGSCGSVPIDGLPGAILDDGTGGKPYFAKGREGTNYEIWLVKQNSPPVSSGESTNSWQFSLAVGGPLLITDISTEQTISCEESEGPECLGRGTFFNTTELTGLPFGEGPQTNDNHGALSRITLGVEGSFLLRDGEWLIARIRVSGRYPSTEGDISDGIIVFAERTGSNERSTSPIIYYKFTPVTEEDGNPPITLSSCGVRLRATRAGMFIRCDANNDAAIDISDAIWMLQQLFLGGPLTRCRAAVDCNADGSSDISDPVFALLYLFSEGTAPKAPFPDCGLVEGLQPQECPKASTGCPQE